MLANKSQQRMKRLHTMICLWKARKFDKGKWINATHWLEIKEDFYPLNWCREELAKFYSLSWFTRGNAQQTINRTEPPPCIKGHKWNPTANIVLKRERLIIFFCKVRNKRKIPTLATSAYQVPRNPYRAKREEKYKVIQTGKEAVKWFLSKNDMTLHAESPKKSSQKPIRTNTQSEQIGTLKISPWRIPRWRLEVGSRKRASYSEILERRWRHTLQA
jgi:hypothetical protein